jgi:hypothetical protein
MAKSVKKIKKSRLYPWFALLEMETSESDKGQVEKAPQAKRGRPSSGLVRKRVGFYQTEDQIQMLDELIQTLEEKLGKSISRGTMISFMTIRLMILLESQAGENGKVQIPEDVKSLTAFAEWLESIE